MISKVQVIPDGLEVEVRVSDGYLVIETRMPEYRETSVLK